MTSLLLRTATRLLMPLLLLFAVFLLLRGHNEPGGGFVAGLVVAMALVLHSMSFGVSASRRVLRVDPSRLLGVGLLVALASGWPAVLQGRAFLSAVWTKVPMGGATVDLGTPLLFDLGVCLVVIGFVLTIVFTLAED
jgi:multicomponent Na+:H+ antiporter subunit B